MTLSDFLRRPALSKCIPNEFKPLRGIQKMSSSHECMRGEVAPRGSPTTDYPATVRVSGTSRPELFASATPLDLSIVSHSLSFRFPLYWITPY